MRNAVEMRIANSRKQPAKLILSLDLFQNASDKR